MFKKAISLGNTNKVSKADRKKILRTLQDRFTLSPEDAEQLLPLKEGDVEATKVSPPSRAVIYTVNAVPIIVDSSGKGDYFPTVFALWQLPTLLPRIYLKHPEVSQFVVKGADLMLPGVDLPSMEAFPEGAVVSICSPGNPAPVGVGVTLMSSTSAAERVQGSQGRGRLVELLHYYGDYLWADMGQAITPNAGFQPGVVLAIAGPADSASDSPAAADPDAADDAQAPQPSAESSAADSSASDAAAAVDQLKLTAEGSEERVAGGGASESAGGESGSGSGSGGQAAVDMEALLETCLLQVLHREVKDKQLPLNSNVLWKLMVAGRPSGTTLDIKKSKHKKLSKFLQAQHKAGLLKAKEDKHSGDSILTSINRNHPLYTSYSPYKTSASSDSGAAAPGAPSTSSQVTISDAYKPCKDMRPIFEAVGLKHDGLYNADDAYSAVQQYIEREGLAGAPGVAEGQVALDAHLCDALYKGVVNVKKGERYPSAVARAGLREAWLGRCSQQYLISRGDKAVVKKAHPIVNVVTQKRQGAKKVTCVEGLEAFLLDPQDVAAECQKLFASAATVNELPGKQAGCEVVVQGSVAEKLAAHLAAAHGIPKTSLKVKA